MRHRTLTLLLVGAVISTACTEDPAPLEPDALLGVDAPAFARSNGTPFEMDAAVQAEIEERLTEYVKQRAVEIQAQRLEAGAVLPEDVALAPLGFSWIGELDGQTVGREVFFLDRGNKQLSVQWVPGDPRRGGRTDIGYAVDEVFGFGNYTAPGVSAAESLAAIDRAVETWESQRCSRRLDMPKSGFLEWLLFESDVFHEGFFPLPPGVLGVTAPFIFVDAVTGEPTDIDSDGNLDYAFAVITYNSLFQWGIDQNIDVETIALHEMGHGLGQAHFGTAFVTTSNDKLHFAPRSVMNAAYSGVQQELTGTDRAGHCSLFGSWPNN